MDNVLCEACKRLCRCERCGGNCPGDSGANFDVTTLDPTALVAVASKFSSMLSNRALGGSVITRLHVTPDGGKLVSAGYVHPDGNSGSIHLEGSIGPIPYDLEISITLDMAARTVTARLQVRQPVQFDHTWIYNMEGVVPIAQGLSVASLNLAPG